MLSSKGRDGAQIGKERPVSIGTSQVNGKAGLDIRFFVDRRNVDAGGFHLLQHEVPENVITAQSHELCAQPQANCAMGSDDSRPSHDQFSLVYSLLNLPELGHDVPLEYQVRVDFAHDEQICFARRIH